MDSRLGRGDPFPDMTASTIDGRVLRLPGDLGGTFSILVFYRASWCPYCRRQLAGYRDHHDALLKEGVSVLALSAEPLESARSIVEQERLPFPVAYGLLVPEDAVRVGAAWDEKRTLVQPAEFVLDSERRVLHANYSSGPIGRTAAADVLAWLRFWKSKER